MDQQRQKLKLDQVIQCLVQQQKFVTLALDRSQNINHLYESTHALLTQFQQHINRCKKYNQAKIHRKYQILIADLSRQNQILKLKVSEQLQARPSSQMYVSDLINKMIEMRKHNQKLMRENQALQNMLNSFAEKAKIFVNTKVQFSNNTQNNQLLRKQSQKLFIKQSLNQFIANKKVENKNIKVKQKSNFQKFLCFNKSSIQRWTLLDFFQKIDKWTSHLKDLRFLERSKIKTSFQNHFEKDTDVSPSVEEFPVTVNSLVIKKQVKSYLQSGFGKKTKLFDRVLSNKKTSPFRIKSLPRERSKIGLKTIE